MALQATGIVDLAALTLPHLDRFQFNEIASELQDHVGVRRVFRKERRNVRSGDQIDFDLMVNHSGAAKFAGYYEVDAVNVVDVMAKGTVPWRHANTNFAYDLHEVDVNRDPARIIDILKVRRGLNDRFDGTH